MKMTYLLLPLVLLNVMGACSTGVESEEAMLTGFVLAPNSLELQVGDTARVQITEYYFQQGASRSFSSPSPPPGTKVTWSISPVEIARIDTQGLVTALQAGEAYVITRIEQYTNTVPLRVRAQPTRHQGSGDSLHVPFVGEE